VMAAFTAKYPGTCHTCDKRFRKGAYVRYDSSDKIVHARDCLDEEDEAPTLEQEEHEYDSREFPNPDELGHVPPDRCPRCFLVHAGECL